MKTIFNVEECLEKIKHYLPAQAPLKDFVHHNTLHSFQEKPFFEALKSSNEIFGFKTSLSLSEYREIYQAEKISDTVLTWVLANVKSDIPLEERRKLLFSQKDTLAYSKRIGRLRSFWKKTLHIDLNTITHLNLFKLVGSYLDQGITARPFPSSAKGLLTAIQEVEENTFFEFFHSERVKKLLFKGEPKLKELLEIVVGDAAYYEQYIFDQQFSHPGWSGIVCVIEQKPETLFERKEITFHDFVYLELLLEIDALDKIYGEGKWKPITSLTTEPPIDILNSNGFSQEWEVKQWWQEILEFSYFDQVLLGLKEKSEQIAATEKQTIIKRTPSFQACFCIDDREESVRRHIEALDTECETFGTPAHYNLPIFYNPAGGKFNTQVCPGGISPEHIIVDDRTSEKHKRDLHFHQSSHNWMSGWVISQTMGFWSALKLFISIFRPSVSPGHSSSFEHMSHKSNLIIKNENGETKDGLQVGFTLSEMCNIVESELRRTGLTDSFARIVYLFGHGGSSTNNPYYAGYNCGACSGRPSSLNSRVFAAMANREDVRKYLAENDIKIPKETQFLGGLHDTTRDEFVFYDEAQLSEVNQLSHLRNQQVFAVGLENNAKERARQFISVHINRSAKEVHKEVKSRSVALFEPRPELNHSNNCLCIVGSRKMTRNLFLDQRAFLNSYNWKTDPNGDLLLDILNAATPVCGGINLEYYFSRVDNENFGAGSKLPHNVVGLFGVSNGIEGDLRTGLPIQMVEVHDPLRLMMIIEQKPNVVLKTIKTNPATLEWYVNDWVKLAVIDPETKETFLLKDGQFVSYIPLTSKINTVEDLEIIFESNIENLPVLNI